MLTPYEKFKNILKEMFQMEQADLDFGIYRIMNAKRNEIEKFLDEELLPQVKKEFAKYRGAEIEEKKKEISRLEATLRDSGVNPDDAPKVMALREEIAKYGDDEALANEVFSHLSAFFRRYYDNGDFLSLRWYKKDTYAIPYEGEEVKLHWANADQYYIKTSEYLRDSVFKLPDGTRAHFKLVDASQEAEEPIHIEGKEVFIQFVYLPDKEKQDHHNKKTLEVLHAEFSGKLKDFPMLFVPAPTAKNPKRTLLEKHLYAYTARFNFDFFIHKDLGGFLRREIDFYIKNEVLFVDDLDAQDEKKLKSAVAKVKVIKHIAQKIITFLASLEDFQKKLWLKKKFVVSSGYCVTLDKVPQNLYAEIARNDDQREEWVRLFAINEIKKDLTRPGYSKPLTMEFLKANPYLVLDTKHFDDKFKDKLLASFENLDEATDGVIINSGNFQALNLLQEKYREQVKCVYIDPPYNTGQSEIVDGIFPGYDRNMVVVNHHPQGGMSHNISRTHEYMLIMTLKGEDIIRGKGKSGEVEYRSFMLSGPRDNKSRKGRPNSFYALLIDEINNKIVGVEPPPIANDKYPTSKTVEGYTRRYPISPSGEEKVWCRAYESAISGLENEEILITQSGSIKLAVDTKHKRHSLMSN